MIQIIKEIWSFDLNILTDKIIKEISTNKYQRKIFCTILTEKNLRLIISRVFFCIHVYTISNILCIFEKKK